MLTKWAISIKRNKKFFSFIFLLFPPNSFQPSDSEQSSHFLSIRNSKRKKGGREREEGGIPAKHKSIGRSNTFESVRFGYYWVFSVFSNLNVIIFWKKYILLGFKINFFWKITPSNLILKLNKYLFKSFIFIFSFDPVCLCLIPPPSNGRELLICSQKNDVSKVAELMIRSDES